MVALGAVLIGLGLRDLLWRSLRLPQRVIPIPQSVFVGSHRRGLFRFGVEYGSGVRTLVTAAAPVVVALGLVLDAPHPPIGVMLGAAFGVSRGLAPLLHLVLQSPTWQDQVARQMRMTSALGTLLTAALVGLAAFSDG